MSSDCAAGRPTAMIELGGLVGDPAGERGGPEHAAIRLRFAAEALAILRYDAVALAPGDLRLGAGRALEILRDRLGPATRLVAANVEPAEAHRAIVRPSVVVEAGPVRLGVTAVVEPAAMAAVPDVRMHFSAIRSPEEALPAVLADLESRSDFQVLMVQGPPELAARLAGSFPTLEIVVATSDADTPRSRHPEALNDGRTTLVNVGRKGMYVGAFAFAGGPGRRPRYRLLTLDDRYDGPGGGLKERVQDGYRAALRSARLVEEAPRRRPREGASYVGARACRSCHPRTYERWAATPHARAFESILRDPRPDVAFDPDCVACHATGSGFASGWRSREATPHLAGNQCENCHGPGSRHAGDPDDRAFRRALAIGEDRARRALCARCHDHDNAPGFDPDRGWSSILHDRLDTYTDTKTHRRSSPGGSPAAGTGNAR